MFKNKPESDLNEEGNVVGGGAIAGCGVGADGEPGVHRDRRKVAALLIDMFKRKTKPE